MKENAMTELNKVRQKHPAIPAFEEYLHLRGVCDSLPDNAPEEQVTTLNLKRDEALHTFLTTRCTLSWLIVEKFRAFESEVMHPDHYNGPNLGHTWLGALKADAITIADLARTNSIPD